MEDVFAGAEFGVERDGGRIDVAGLDVDDLVAALSGDFFEFGDKRRGDALAAVGFVDGADGAAPSSRKRRRGVGGAFMRRRSLSPVPRGHLRCGSFD